MNRKADNVIFKSFNEYQTFYSSDSVKSNKKGTKFYTIGENIAKMVCEKAISELTKAKESELLK